MNPLIRTIRLVRSVIMWFYFCLFFPIKYNNSRKHFIDSSLTSWINFSKLEVRRAKKKLISMQTTVSHRKMAPSTTKSNRKIFYGSGNTIFYSISLSVFVFSILINLVSSIDHCSKHRYKNSINSTHMQFTKEVVSQEYTTLGQFKSLHCCAKGYRSIEW